MKKRLIMVCLTLSMLLAMLPYVLKPNIETVNAYSFDEDWMYKVRNAIRLGQDFINRLYKTTNNSAWGMISEYPTTNPIGYYVYETGSKHTAGDADMCGTPGNNPSYWYRYFDMKDPGPWYFVEPKTRDWIYIIDGGFEEDDRMDPIKGDMAFMDDCNEPCVTIEFEPTQLLKNPSVEFRKYNNDNVDYDDPWDWTKTTSGNAIARMGYLAIGSPNNENGAGSHTGYYCLVLDPKGYTCSWQQAISNLKANTEYYFALAFYGKIPYPIPDQIYARLEIQWCDAQWNTIKTDYVHLPYGDWTGIGWVYGWEFWTSPANTANAYFRVKMQATSAYWLYLDTMYACEKNNVGSNWTNPIGTSRTAFQITNYLGDRHMDVYLDNELVAVNVSASYVGPNGPHPRPYFSKEKQTFQSMRTAIRHECPLGMWLYKYSIDSSDWNDKYLKMKAVRDYYDIYSTAEWPSYDWYEPMYRVTDSWPDNWYWNNRGPIDGYPGWYEYNSIYDYKYGDTDWYYNPYGKEPFRDVNQHPYRSKVLVDPRLFMEGPWTIPPYIMLGHKYHPISLSMYALHILLKYNDPNYVTDYWGMGNCTPAGLVFGPSYGQSPAGYVLQYWTDYGIKYPNDADMYTATNQAIVSAVMSTLAYGYGYTNGKYYADRLAEILCDIQWGNPESEISGGILHWGKHETWGYINRPDCTGGFTIVYKHGSGFYASQNAYYFDELVDFMFGMPKEVYGGVFMFTPVNQESQLCLRALQIYDWYAFKKDGATNSEKFPKLIIFADINGDGIVDNIDYDAMIRAYQQWNPLCDVNLDHQINSMDFLNLLRNAGRPIKFYYYYTNEFDNTKMDWGECGLNPFLSKIDYPSNYVLYQGYCSRKEEGIWSFPDSQLEKCETIISVKLEIYLMASEDPDLGWPSLSAYVFDGLSYTVFTISTNCSQWHWQTVTITEKIDNWQKLDACKVYLQLSEGCQAAIFIDCMRLVATTED